MKTIYTAKAISVSGREGHVATEDGALDLDIVRPDSGKEGTNPEQLFASAWSACFGGAVAAVAKKMDVTTGEVRVEADISLNQHEGAFFLSAVLTTTLPEADRETAEKIVAEAHKLCPYSKATRNNIKVDLVANGQKVRQDVSHAA